VTAVEGSVGSRRDPPSRALLWSLAAGAVLLHAAASAAGGYGLFRDELYYLACARHPGAGYVDHPPFSIWLLSAWQFLWGDSLFAIRMVPALLAGATTLLVGTLAREFGGGRYAVALAAVASVFAPIFLGFFGIYSMNAVDLALWGVTFLLLARVARGGKPADWCLLGLAIGVGALNKISMLWLGAGIGLGIVLTPLRPALKTGGPWLAAAIAGAAFAPFVVWNAQHGFAHLEFIRNASAEKYASQDLGSFAAGLAQFMNPLATPLWLAGGWFLLSRREHRAAGIAVAAVLGVLVLNVHSKPEYFAAAMTALVPAGAVQFERIFERRALRWFRAPYLALLAATGALLLPLTLDVLPVETFVGYQARLGLSPKSNEGLAMASLPQHYADRFGWEEMAAAVARAYAALPDSEKTRSLPYGRNYGEAAAIDYFGRRAGLPPAVCAHNSYWYWSAGRLAADATYLVLARPDDRLLREFTDVRQAETIRTAYAMPYETGLSVFVCRGLRRPAAEFWADEKNFM
jgi:hypothetical protein